GEKMSKSRGNLVLVSRLRDEGADPMAIRLALLNHHYLGDWEWTAQDLPAATERLARWRSAGAAGARPPARHPPPEGREALSDDLAAPRALRAVDSWVDEQHAHGGADATAPGLVRDTVDALLGVAL